MLLSRSIKRFPFTAGELSIAAMTLLWLLSVSFGMVQLVRHAGASGPAGQTPTVWPEKWSVRPAADGVTVIVTLHPRCPCSKATLAELDRILSRAQHRCQTIVLFVRPAGSEDAGEKSDLRQQAQTIPGVTVMTDPDGVIAAKLGALTSGLVSAFDPQGKLLFRGGITPARGHRGDSAGGDALGAILTHQTPSQTRSSVFGCALSERTR